MNFTKRRKRRLYVLERLRTMDRDKPIHKGIAQQLVPPKRKAS